MARVYGGATPLDQWYSAAYDSKEVNQSDIWDQMLKQEMKASSNAQDRAMISFTYSEWEQNKQHYSMSKEEEIKILSESFAKLISSNT